MSHKSEKILPVCIIQNYSQLTKTIRYQPALLLCQAVVQKESGTVTLFSSKFANVFCSSETLSSSEDEDFFGWKCLKSIELPKTHFWGLLYYSQTKKYGPSRISHPQKS